MEQLDFSIKSSKNILLVSHINPDGDTLGSMCGMYSLIKDNYKKSCDMVVVSSYPNTYKFLPNSDRVLNIKELDMSREYDLVINLDVADLQRCADAKILFEKAKKTVNIDHHETNDGYADINIIYPEASATAEVIYDICENLGWKVSYDCALCLYVGIMTDTGSFRYSNTTPKAMDFAGKLIACGIDISDVYRKCYESNSKNMVMFQNYCVLKAQFVNDDKIAYTTVYKKDLEKFHHSEGDDFTDGLTEKLRAINTTEIAFVVKELGANLSKVSMRSKTKNIAKVCAEFGGGGHEFAAGAVIKANVEIAVSQLIEKIKELNLC